LHRPRGRRRRLHCRLHHARQSTPGGGTNTVTPPRHAVHYLRGLALEETRMCRGTNAAWIPDSPPRW
jgi:hypothetical protein